MSFRDELRLTHDLARHYPALRAIRRRPALEASALWSDIGSEVARVLSGVERARHRAARPRPLEGLRVVAWNLHRGIHLEALKAALTTHPALRQADALLLLVEVDHGLGRSGGRHVARELAEALGMSYAFAPSYLVLSDAPGENPRRAPNGLALAGCAVLSRCPIVRAEGVSLPILRDKLHSSEQRLGHKRALVVELELTDGPLTLAAAHLDSNASPQERAAQLEALLGRVEGFGGERALLGGDLNSTTYDLSSNGALLRDLLGKLRSGLRRSAAQMMTPEQGAERPLFQVLARRGWIHQGFNQRGVGTLRFDLDDPFAWDKAERAVGRPGAALLRAWARRWLGPVPAQLDWFAGRSLSAARAQVIAAPSAGQRPATDHAAVVVDLAAA